MAATTKSPGRMLLYGTCILLGNTAGNAITLYQIPLPIGRFGLAVVGVFAGIYIGCLAGALSEVINLFPIISRRTGIRHGMPYILLAIAIGKSVGTLIQYFVIQVK